MEGPWANIKAGCRGSHHPIHIANWGGVLGGMGAPHIHFNLLFLEHRTNAFLRWWLRRTWNPIFSRLNFIGWQGGCMGGGANYLGSCTCVILFAHEGISSRKHATRLPISCLLGFVHQFFWSYPCFIFLFSRRVSHWTMSATSSAQTFFVVWAWTCVLLKWLIILYVHIYSLPQIFLGSTPTRRRFIDTHSRDEQHTQEEETSTCIKHARRRFFFWRSPWTGPPAASAVLYWGSNS